MLFVRMEARTDERTDGRMVTLNVSDYLVARAYNSGVFVTFYISTLRYSVEISFKVVYMTIRNHIWYAENEELILD